MVHKIEKDFTEGGKNDIISCRIMFLKSKIRQGLPIGSFGGKEGNEALSARAAGLGG